MNVLVLSALESTAMFSPSQVATEGGEIWDFPLLFAGNGLGPLQKDDEMVMHNLNGDNGEARDVDWKIAHGRSYSLKRL